MCFISWSTFKSDVCDQMKIWATGILIITSRSKCSLKFIIIIHSFSSHFTTHTNIRRITIAINTNRKLFSLKRNRYNNPTSLATGELYFHFKKLFIVYLLPAMFNLSHCFIVGEAILRIVVIHWF